MKKALSRIFTRDRVTSLGEVIGAGCVIAGCALLFGIGISLIVAGVLVMALSYFASGDTE